MSKVQDESAIGIWHPNKLAELGGGGGPFALGVPLESDTIEQLDNTQLPHELSEGHFSALVNTLSEGRQLISMPYYLQILKPTIQAALLLEKCEAKNTLLNRFDAYIQGVIHMHASPSIAQLELCLHECRQLQRNINRFAKLRNNHAQPLRMLDITNILVLTERLSTIAAPISPLHAICKSIMKLAEYFDPQADTPKPLLQHELNSLHQLLDECVTISRLNASDQLRAYQELIIAYYYAAERNPSLWCPVIVTMAEFAPTQQLKDNTLRFARTQDLLQLAKEKRVTFSARVILHHMAPGQVEQSTPFANLSQKQHQQLLDDYLILENFLRKPNTEKTLQPYIQMASRYQTSASKLSQLTGLLLIIIGITLAVSGALLIASMYSHHVALQASLHLPRIIRTYLYAISSLNISLGALIIAGGAYLLHFGRGHNQEGFYPLQCQLLSENIKDTERTTEKRVDILPQLN